MFVLSASAVNTNLISDNVNSYVNLVYTHDKYFNVSRASSFEFPAMNPTEVVLHETGHNAARNNVHGHPRYDYDDNGMSSNVGTRLRPTNRNTIEVLNDELYRTNSINDTQE